MSDDRLRELERAWRQGGSVGDEAAWLAERRRAGALHDELLEAAGLLGHRAARVVLGREGVALPEGEVTAADVVRQVRPDPVERLADLTAVAAALAEAVLPLLGDVEGPLARSALGALTAALTCPCAHHDADLAAAAARLGEHLDAVEPVPGPSTSRARWAAEVIQDAALIARRVEGAEQIAVAVWWDARRLLGRKALQAVARRVLVARWLSA